MKTIISQRGSENSLYCDRNGTLDAKAMEVRVKAGSGDKTMPDGAAKVNDRGFAPAIGEILLPLRESPAPAIGA